MNDPFLTKLIKLKEQYKEQNIKSKVYKNFKVKCKICDKIVMISGGYMHIAKSLEHKYLLKKHHNPEEFDTDGVQSFYVESYSKPGYQFPDLRNVEENMKDYLRQIKGYCIAQLHRDTLRKKYTLREILHTDKLNIHGRLKTEVMEKIRQEYLETLL